MNYRSREELARKREQVAVMRAKGMTFREIGKHFGFTPQRAQQLWAKWLERQNKSEMERALGMFAPRFMRYGYTSLDDFRDITNEELLRLRSVGKKSLMVLKDTLDDFGIENRIKL